MWLCFAVTAPFGSLPPREDLLRGRELKRACGGGLAFPNDQMMQFCRYEEKPRLTVFVSGRGVRVRGLLGALREVCSGGWRVKTKDRRQMEEESVQAGRFN